MRRAKRRGGARSERVREREGGTGEGVGERAGLGGFVTMNTEGNEL